MRAAQISAGVPRDFNRPIREQTDLWCQTHQRCSAFAEAVIHVEGLNFFNLEYDTSSRPTAESTETPRARRPLEKTSTERTGPSPQRTSHQMIPRNVLQLMKSAPSRVPTESCPEGGMVRPLNTFSLPGINVALESASNYRCDNVDCELKKKRT